MSVKFDKVLLVDDDNINNFLSEEIIAGANITNEVILLTDGQQAINYLNSLGFEEGHHSQKLLILLDLNMPVMDGFEFLEEFDPEKLKAEFVIIILTSSDNQRDIDKIKTYNIQNFISKPITEEKLLEVLK
jgi:CheY-like chemotaxis protein